MGKGAPLCDACNKRIRPNHHELRLTDPLTGQVIGHYHVDPDCQQGAAKYLVGGAVLLCTYFHPDHCGPNQERCDGGLSESAA